MVEFGRVSAGSAKSRVAELRALLRYLFLKGWTSRPLAAAIPPVADWHGTTIPKVVSVGAHIIETGTDSYRLRSTRHTRTRNAS